MGKRGHSEEEILRVLGKAESGDTVVEVCPRRGISQQSLYLRRKKYAGLGLQELGEPRQLRDDNAKLKRLADLRLRISTSQRLSFLGFGSVLNLRRSAEQN